MIGSKLLGWTTQSSRRLRLILDRNRADVWLKTTHPVYLGWLRILWITGTVAIIACACSNHLRLDTPARKGNVRIERAKPFFLRIGHQAENQAAQRATEVRAQSRRGEQENLADAQFLALAVVQPANQPVLDDQSALAMAAQIKLVVGGREIQLQKAFEFFRDDAILGELPEGME